MMTQTSCYPNRMRTGGCPYDTSSFYAQVIKMNATSSVPINHQSEDASRNDVFDDLLPMITKEDVDNCKTLHNGLQLKTKQEEQHVGSTKEKCVHNTKEDNCIQHGHKIVDHLISAKGPTVLWKDKVFNNNDDPPPQHLGENDVASLHMKQQRDIVLDDIFPVQHIKQQ